MNDLLNNGPSGQLTEALQKGINSGDPKVIIGTIAVAALALAGMAIKAIGQCNK